MQKNPKTSQVPRSFVLVALFFSLVVPQPVLAFTELPSAQYTIVREPFPLPDVPKNAIRGVWYTTEVDSVSQSTPPLTGRIPPASVATSTVHHVCKMDMEDDNNLILNPSVESASTSPSLPMFWYKGGYGTNSRTLTYPVTGRGCGRGIKAEITNYTSGDATWYFKDVAAIPGQAYSYTDYYKSSIPSTITIQYTRQDGTMCWPDLAVGIPASPTVWTKFNSTFTVPSLGGVCGSTSPIVSMSVFHLIENVGWVVTDDFALRPYTPDTSNLFYNPSVEIPSANPSMPDGWLKATSAGSTAFYTYPATPAQDGPRAARVDVTAYTGGAGAKWYPGYVPVSGGEEYKFSNYYKSTTDSFITVQFQMGNGTTTTYQYLDLMRLVSTGDTWKKAEDTFMVPQGATALTVIHLIQSVGALTVDNYSLKKLPSGKFNNGMITLHFDDGPISIWNNGRPIFNATSTFIRTSQNVITEYIDDPVSAYMTSAQWMTLKNEGHEIDSHTRTHAHLMSLSQAELTSEVAGSKADLIAAGFNPQAFVYPYGEFNDVVKNAVISAGYRGARSVRRGFNTKNTNPFELVDQSFDASVTPAQIMAYIDQAKADKTWLILELHDVLDSAPGIYYTTPADLITVINYIKSSGIQVVQTSEGLAAMGY